MNENQTPADLRQSVRTQIVASLRRDLELRGGRTARLLILAGVVGVTGALGATLLVTGHSFGHHAKWHVAAVSAVWAGLLVVTLAIALLQIRTPSMPLARSAAVGLIGLGIAGVCGAACPDSHFLGWWSYTRAGAEITESLGPALGALCFGMATTVAFGAAAALIALSRTRSRPIRPFLPAAVLLVLLSPGVALQSVGTSWMVFAGWLAGTAAGAYVGVLSGMQLRRSFLD